MKKKTSGWSQPFHVQLLKHGEKTARSGGFMDQHLVSGSPRSGPWHKRGEIIPSSLWYMLVSWQETRFFFSFYLFTMRFENCLIFFGIVFPFVGILWLDWGRGLSLVLNVLLLLLMIMFPSELLLWDSSRKEYMKRTEVYRVYWTSILRNSIYKNLSVTVITDKEMSL